MKEIIKGIDQEVIEVLAKTLAINIEKIKPSSKLVDDLGLDSLGAIEIQFAMKDKFKIDFDQVDFKNIENVGDITEYISSSLKKKMIKV